MTSLIITTMMSTSVEVFSTITGAPVQVEVASTQNDTSSPSPEPVSAVELNIIEVESVLSGNTSNIKLVVNGESSPSPLASSDDDNTDVIVVSSQGPATGSGTLGAGVLTPQEASGCMCISLHIFKTDCTCHSRHCSACHSQRPGGVCCQDEVLWCPTSAHPDLQRHSQR